MGRGWDCEAYGAAAQEAGIEDLCFHEAFGECTSLEQCHDRMAEARQQLFRRISEQAAQHPENVTWRFLASEFGSPDELLHGDDPDSR